MIQPNYRPCTAPRQPIDDSSEVLNPEFVQGAGIVDDRPKCPEGMLPEIPQDVLNPEFITGFYL